MKYLYAILFVILVPSLLASNSIIYLQGFDNDTGSFQRSDPYGWQTYSGGSLTTASRVHFHNGADAVENVNALTPFGDNITQGHWIANVGVSQFSFTEFLLPQSYSDLTFSFKSNHNSGHDSDWYVAIRTSSGDWFASAQASDGNNWSDPAFTVALTSESLWRPFEFDPGTSIGLTEDPLVSYSSFASDITAFGFFGDIRASTTHRIDNYTVSGVIPEPSTYAAILGLGALVFVLFRRRKGAQGE